MERDKQETFLNLMHIINFIKGNDIGFEFCAIDISFRENAIWREEPSHSCYGRLISSLVKKGDFVVRIADNWHPTKNEKQRWFRLIAPIPEKFYRLKNYDEWTAIRNKRNKTQNQSEWYEETIKCVACKGTGEIVTYKPKETILEKLYEDFRKTNPKYKTPNERKNGDH
jgi:hypothetical protein